METIGGRSGRAGRRDGTAPWWRAWAQDSGLMLASQGALTATATAVMVLLARRLSTYDFGLFSSFLGVAQAFSLVIDAGLSTWLLRECATIRGRSDDAAAQDRALADVLWTGLTLAGYIGGVTILASGGVGFAVGLPWSLVLAQGAFMAYVAILAAASALEARLRAERRLRSVAAALTCEKVGLAAFVVGGLALGGGVLGVSVAYVLAGALRLGVDFAIALRPLPPRSRRRRFAEALTQLRAIIPFGVTAATMGFVTRLDTVCVAAVSVLAASYYALGFQIVTTAAVVPVILSVTLLPMIVSGRARDPSRTVPVMTGAGVLLGGAGAVLAPYVVPALFGSRYRHAVPTVQIMMVSVPCIFFCNAVLPFLYARGLERVVLRYVALPSLAGTPLVVGGAIVAGAQGASLGLVVRYIGLTGAFALLYGRLRASRASGDPPETALQPADESVRTVVTVTPTDSSSDRHMAFARSNAPAVRAYVARVCGPNVPVGVVEHALLRVAQIPGYPPLRRGSADGVREAARDVALAQVRHAMRRSRVRIRHALRGQFGGHADIPDDLRRRAEGLLTTGELRRLYSTLSRCSYCGGLAHRFEVAEWQLCLAVADSVQVTDERVVEGVPTMPRDGCDAVPERQDA